MAKGEIYLVPTVLEATDPHTLAKMVSVERQKRGQDYAVAHYTSAYVPRPNGTGYTKHFAFIEFATEEK